MALLSESDKTVNVVAGKCTPKTVSIVIYVFLGFGPSIRIHHFTNIMILPTARLKVCKSNYIIRRRIDGFHFSCSLVCRILACRLLSAHVMPIQYASSCCATIVVVVAAAVNSKREFSACNVFVFADQIELRMNGVCQVRAKQQSFRFYFAANDHTTCQHIQIQSFSAPFYCVVFAHAAHCKFIEFD